MNKNAHGPVGTKLGTFIMNDQLQIKNEHFPLNRYDGLLINSIETGLEWLRKNVHLLGLQKYDTLLVKVEEQFNKGYTEGLNQRIIELAYDVLSKINDVGASSLSKKTPEVKPKNKLNNHLGALNLNDISLVDVNVDKYVFVETFPGNYVLCLYVKHNDHFDLLPYDYIAKKIPNFHINF